MPVLALLRHGQSQWNLENRFTGWVDVDLTGTGEAQAARSGELLKANGVDFSQAFTSMQTRAIRTLWIALREMDACWLPETKSWRLNERSYGALTGLNKDETVAQHGAEQVKVWRRSYDTPPPPLDMDDPRHPRHDARYASVPVEQLPASESLAMTLDRVLPFWSGTIAPALGTGNVLVSAHGNSLRAIVKHVFHLSADDIMEVEIPTGNPLVVELDHTLKPLTARYLDPDRASPLPPLPA